MKLASCQSGPTQPEGLIGVGPCQGFEKIRLVVKEAVLEMHGERNGMDHDPAWLGEIVHHLEDIVLVQKMLGGAVVGHETIAVLVLFGRAVEIHVEHECAHSPVDIDALVLHSQRLVEEAGRLLAGIVGAEKLWTRRWPSERGKQRLDQILLRTPEILGSELDHLLDSVECAGDLQLSVKLDNWRS